MGVELFTLAITLLNSCFLCLFWIFLLRQRDGEGAVRTDGGRAGSVGRVDGAVGVAAAAAAAPALAARVSRRGQQAAVVVRVQERLGIAAPVRVARQKTDGRGGVGRRVGRRRWRRRSDGSQRENTQRCAACTISPTHFFLFLFRIGNKDRPLFPLFFFFFFQFLSVFSVLSSFTPSQVTKR